MSDKVNIIMHTKTEDGFIAQHPQTNIEMVEGLAEELQAKADRAEVPKRLSDLEIDLELGKDYDEDIKELHSKAGNLSELRTEDKSSLVNATNEVMDKIIRSSTIVIANYDSHENSKKSADIVIDKGEDAAEIINNAIQSLKDTGGEIKLMEGEYRLDSSVIININNVSIIGLGHATKLKGDMLHVEGTGIIISSLQIKESSSSGILINENANVDITNISCTNNESHGVQLSNNASANISQTTCNNNERNGIALFGNSSANISKVACNQNNLNGIVLADASSASVSQATCNGSTQTGIVLFDNSSANIANVTCNQNNLHGVGTRGETTVTIFDATCSNNDEYGVHLTGNASASVSNATCSNNKSGGVFASSTSKEIVIQNSTLIDNNPNPEYLNLGQLVLGYRNDYNTSNLFATGCKIVDTQGNTRGVVIRGEHHALTNMQFVGEFREKINDDGTDTQLIGNVGV